MSALFITDKQVTLTYSGAQAMTNRNYLSLVDIFGKDNVTVIELKYLYYKSKYSKFIQIIRGYDDFLSEKVVSALLTECQNYEYVVLDFSTWGIIAKKLKESSYNGKIVTFFHNVESAYIWQEIKLKSLIGLIKWFNIYINERMTCRYSDFIICLNNRDAVKINKLYKREPECIVPISLPDKYQIDFYPTGFIASPIQLLFFGSFFWANVNGICWFISHVLPHLNNVELTIVGSGMSQLTTMIANSSIVIYDRVESLQPFIEKADFIISPIFEGSGMKVKTAEALMYGKNIIGTKEAFEGYELDFNAVGAMCNTKEEFISFINSLHKTNTLKFNEYSRSIFLEKYSYNTTLSLLRSVFYSI